MVAPLLRITTWYLFPEFRGIITKAFPTICDTIATGCVLACLRARLSASSRYLAFLGSPAFVVVPHVVFVSNALASHTRPDVLIAALAKVEQNTRLEAQAAPPPALKSLSPRERLPWARSMAQTSAPTHERQRQAVANILSPQQLKELAQMQEQEEATLNQQLQQLSAELERPDSPG